MEWTKEQRELPPLTKPLHNSKYWDSGIEWSVAGERAARMEREDQLTAALDENKRLRSQLKSDDTQLGELAVGGASSENQVRRLIEAINWACGCGDSDFNPYDGNSIKPRYFWRGELVKKAGLAWCHKTGKYTLPAPPSGEQAAMKSERYKRFEEKVCESYLREIGEFGPVEVQDIPKGEV